MSRTQGSTSIKKDSIMAPTSGGASSITSIEERRLDGTDSCFFDSAFAPLNVIMVFSTRGLLGITRSDSKLRKAFTKVVQNSPILQTETVGDGDAAVFRKISDEETDSKLPSLVIEPREASKEEMVGKAKSIKEAIVSNMATEGQLAHRTSVRLHAVRGPRHIAFVLVTPHHFVDGTGIASIMTQMYVRSLLPKKLWWLLPTQLVMPPSFMEMAYKSGECLCQAMICNFQSHTMAND